MKNFKNKRTVILALVLLGLLVVAYKVMFVSSGGSLLADENIAASARVEVILQEVSNIKFDMSIKTDPKFQSLKSIETPLISLPIGKKDPFSAISGSN
jgi:hypothetical protein